MSRHAFEITFPLRRKPTVPPTGAALSPAGGKGRLPRITQVLALAISMKHMIEQGDAKDLADVARLSGLCRERVSQIVRLNYLAPDIQIELLYLPAMIGGRYPITETAMRKVANILSWAIQRERWSELKRVHKLP